MSAASLRFQVAGPEIIAKDFGDELVTANLDTGLFYSLTGSASEIWLDLVAGVPVPSIVDSFVGGNAREIAEFIEKLQAERLLVPSTAIGHAIKALAKRPYLPPLVETFEDLQGLLLVDPIHEVSEAGWPVQADRP